MPLVSVIIPNYNHARYLEQRIKSVLAQTFDDFEIIILDDCSTDESRQIIDRYDAHPKVGSILYNGVNSGSTFSQWNKGIKAASSEFVWIAESDDWCEPSFLETIIPMMAADDDCVVGYCQSYCIIETNIVKWRSKHDKIAEYVQGETFIRDKMIMNNAIFNASMAVWRKSSFNNITNEFLNYKYCGDWLFWIELSKRGNVFISGKPLNYFRKHEGDVSGRTNLAGNNFIEELRMFYLLYQRNWISSQQYLKRLKNEYIHYRAVASTFTPATNKQLLSLFFKEPGKKNRLNFYYYFFYFKHTIKKVLGIK